MILACKEDIETLCKDVAAGNGRWRRCLHDHASKVSAPGRELIGRAIA